MQQDHKLERTIYANGKYYSESEFTPVQFAILQCLQNSDGYMTRYELSQKTGISKSTIFENLIKLCAKDMIIEKIKIPSKRGRPQHFFKINEGDNHYESRRRN